MKVTDQPARSIEEYISSLKNSQKYGPQVVCHRVFDASSALYTKNSINTLSSEIQDVLTTENILNLYKHQGDALRTINNGHNVVVSTPTSSGKSMIYNLPVLQRMLKESRSHALYLFPLKALSQDQLGSLCNFASKILSLDKHWPQGVAAIYDGDTTSYQRRKIRENTPPVIITNPEMLHLSFLPFHENWAHFFANLDYVIIDEVHTYRGVFGSHVAWLIRRLKRIVSLYNKKPLFILSSATIGNPKEFAESLIAERIDTITVSGAPQSKKNFIFLNPWDSPAYTASQLLEAALKRGLRTIVYTQSRKMTELISLWTSPRLGDLSDKLSSYRAGFLAEERREIEQKLSDGSLLGVISTSALELGINIGDLDLCILVGYPGSIMASWQRGGRVGRRGQESAVILIASDDALDQYYMKNPDEFFNKEVESAVLNPRNEKIIKNHLACAAAEYPISTKEELTDPHLQQKCLQELTGTGVLLLSASGEEFYASRKRPQRNVSLRGTGTSLTIINGETGIILGEVDSARSLKECHEGAVYLHRNNTWIVEKLDLGAREVIVQEHKSSFYTKPMSQKDTEILSTLSTASVFGCRISFGNLRVSEKVTAYQKRNKGTNKLIVTIPLDLPEQTIETEGFWLEIPEYIVKLIEEKHFHFMGGLHAFEHVMISVFPLLVLCDRNDIGGISCPHHEQTEGATIFIYDGHHGGSGLSAEAFRKSLQLIKRSYQIVDNCTCDNGCPSCVHSPKCGSGNKPIDKHSCLQLVKAVLQSEAIGSGQVENKNDLEKVEAVRGAERTDLLQFDERKDIASCLETLPEHFGVFDLETKYSADEVGGWHRAEKMGVSVGVVYDSLLDGCVTYYEHEIPQLLEHLFKLKLVVGFNNKRFDNRVLSAYTSENLSTLPTLDLLEEVSNHLGYRLSLNALAEHTLGVQKSGDGLQALRWYQEGNFEKLVKYCKKDVEITRDLMLYGLEKGYVLFRNKAKKTVRLPLQLAKSIGQQMKV
jgi:DEAD/DEAH box helicase domain-containing protein